MKNQEKKLNIGISSFYPPSYGGVTTLVVGLAEYFVDNGHKVHVIGFESDENPYELEKKGVKLHKASELFIPDSPVSLYSWTLASKLFEVHNSVGLDVVNAHYGMPYGGGVLSAKQMVNHFKSKTPSFKSVITGHGSDIHTLGRNPDLNPMMRWVLEESDAVTYVGEGLKKIAETPYEEGGLGSRKKGIVIPNFVNLKTFYPEKNNLKRNLGIPANAFTVVHGSNFMPVKQTEHFYLVAERLFQQGNLDNIYFLLCGEGENKDSLEKKISETPFREHFKFLGRQNLSGMQKAYNSADVSALTSKNEGCPLAVLESMACGTPVIGTDVQGINWLIEEGKTGFLIKPYDISGFAELLNSLKTKKSLIKKMGYNSRRKIESEHTVETIGRRYLDLFYSLVNEKV